MASRPAPITSPRHPVPCSGPGCGAPIWFRAVRNGHGGVPGLMPLDAEPSDAGNVAAYPLRDWVDGRVISDGDQIDTEGGEMTFVPHFMTCRTPSKFRKRDKARPVREPGEPAQLALIPATTEGPQ